MITNKKCYHAPIYCVYVCVCVCVCVCRAGWVRGVFSVVASASLGGAPPEDYTFLIIDT